METQTKYLKGILVLILGSLFCFSIKYVIITHFCNIEEGKKVSPPQYVQFLVAYIYNLLFIIH